MVFEKYLRLLVFQAEIGGIDRKIVCCRDGDCDGDCDVGRESSG